MVSTAAASHPSRCELQARAGSGRARQVANGVCVHVSGCASLLLYGLDTYASRQLGQIPVSHASSQGLGKVRLSGDLAGLRHA